jgi:hypothetical protein
MSELNANGRFISVFGDDWDHVGPIEDIVSQAQSGRVFS